MSVSIVPPGKPLKVMVAHHRWWYPTAVNGGDLANHEFARMLRKYNVDVRVFGINPPGGSDRALSRRYNAEGVPVFLVRSDFIRHLKAEIRSFKPDVVMTSCPEPTASADDVRRMVDSIASCDLPLVLYVHDLEGTLPLFRGVKEQLARVITNSHFMAHKIEQLWSTKCDVVYPVPNLHSFNVETPGPFITLISPAPHKGLEIAEKLARDHFPKRSFLFVEGLIDPETHAIELSRRDNLVYAHCSPDLATIYSLTDTLIVPSQWEEPFGRIVLEAMYNRIPVVASKTGGLVEAVGEGGLFVEDFTSVEQWALAIERLDNPKLREKIVEAGTHQASKFSLRDETKKMIDILYQVAL